MNDQKKQWKWFAIISIAGSSLAGCTPADEQVIADAINTVVQGLASQAISFVLDFGRQSLAAFLF